MKFLCLVLLLAVIAPGCSIFSSKSDRERRAYSKYVKKQSAGRDRQRSKIIQQRAEPPSLRTQPTPGPVQESIQTSEGQ
jgi:hypothetical protein